MSKIENIIVRGEGKTVEFKVSLPRGDSLARTVIAFSNMAGGKILVGIEDKTGKVVGINEQEVLDFPDRISNTIYDTCTPAIIPEIYTVRVHDKNVLVVEVFPASSKPYFLKKRGKHKGVYIRVGATNKIADTEMLLELERQRRNIFLDEEIDYNLNEKDIDFARLQQDFEGYTQRKLKENDLLNLRLLREQSGKLYPTIGGMLIGGKKRYFEYSRIKCARFKGNDMAEFIDQKEFSGPLYRQVENAMKFAMVYIAKSGRIEVLQRIDTYEVPRAAVREALVNAVVHRDYSISGSDIKFAIFDDRIEITSPGALPKALDVDDILSGRSEIRNRVIARFFKEINFIEQWGTGIGKILQACREAGLRDPEFRESGLFFKVTLYKNNRLENEYTKNSRNGSQNTSQKDSQNTSQKIIECMKDNPATTIRELSLSTGLSDRGIKNHIYKLKNHGKIRRIGPDRGGHWEVVEAS